MADIQPSGATAPVLLPQPRHAEWSGRSVSAGPPSVGSDPSLPPEGYRLRIGDDGAVTVEASDDAGAFYARATLDQLARGAPGELPVGTVEDWPDLAVRAVMLDVSRDKVPTMDTLRTLVDRLASWKVNQVQLYMEHTFAYADHDDVWRDASPFTAGEIAELDNWCRERHVELVPNLNTLGHMERWLIHDRYRSLAISPEGVERFGRFGYPTTLDPTNPGSLPLIKSLLAELLPNFTSRRVHVGLDEPWELPRERMGEYADWIRALRALHELDDREMLIWADICFQHAELVDTVPEGVTLCEWGYEDWHPFGQRASYLAERQKPFWLCPGTSSWLTVLGRWTNARANISAAAEAAVEHGAAGLLNTDWGDFGHLHYLPISEPGLAFGAAMSWCPATNRDLDMASALDAHCYLDGAGVLGATLLELGDVHRGLSMQLPNVSSLVMHLYYPELHVGRGPLHGVTADEYQQVADRLHALRGRLADARPRRPDGQLVLDEIRNAVDLVLVLCADARARLAASQSIESVPESERVALSQQLAPVIERHKELWLARNRPGGLADSVRRLTDLDTAYRTGNTDHCRVWKLSEAQS